MPVKFKFKRRLNLKLNRLQPDPRVEGRKCNHRASFRCAPVRDFFLVARNRDAHIRQYRVREERILSRSVGDPEISGKNKEKEKNFKAWKRTRVAKRSVFFHEKDKSIRGR